MVQLLVQIKTLQEMVNPLPPPVNFTAPLEVLSNL